MLDEQTKTLLEQYNKGLAAYKNMKFKEALEHFKEAVNTKPDDGPSKLYIERCEAFIENPPPAEWDGVFTMTTK